MKNIKSFLLLAFLFASISSFAKERVIERPAFTAWSGSIIEIDKIVLNEAETVLHIQAFFTPNYWITIPRVTYLIADNGEKYQIQSADGIPLDEEFYMPASGEASFTLTFPPIPDTVKQIDFIEDVDNGFKIWGIRLDGKLPEVELPKDIVKHQINKNAVLPAYALQKGKASLKGKLLGYTPALMNDFTLQVSNPYGSIKQIKVPVNNDGSFQTEVEVISPTPCGVYMGKSLHFFLAPDQETTVYINLPEVYREQSRLRKNEQSTGKAIYINGFMAAVAEEYNENNNFDDSKDIFSELADKDLNGIKEYFINNYNERRQKIDGMDVSEACKQIYRSQMDAILAMNMLNVKNYHMQSLLMNNKLKREEAGEYYSKLTLPENYFDEFSMLGSINTPEAIYNTTFARLVGYPTFLENYSKAQGTDKGLYFELSNVSNIFRKIDDFTTLTDEDRNMLKGLSSPAYLELAEANNTALLAQMEANKKKTGFKVNEAGEVANEDLFASMIAPFRGKVVLVDFWATWCGPCRVANKNMAPMKEELKDKGIVYLYIAGENSPEKTWENMIPDIPGEHFRVTADQWKYLGDTFKVEGVPTYMVVDTEGNITYKSVGFPGVEKMKEELIKGL